MWHRNHPSAGGSREQTVSPRPPRSGGLSSIRTSLAGQSCPSPTARTGRCSSLTFVNYWRCWDLSFLSQSQNLRQGSNLGGFASVEWRALRGHDHRTRDGYVVLQGSTALLHERQWAKRCRSRKQSIANDTLIQKDGFYQFTKDVGFLVQGGRSL